MVADRSGCLATNFPMTLIQMDLLQRNLDRGCPLVVDIGGYSYYHVDSGYSDVSRRKNADFQAVILAYYRLRPMPWCRSASPPGPGYKKAHRQGGSRPWPVDRRVRTVPSSGNPAAAAPMTRVTSHAQILGLLRGVEPGNLRRLRPRTPS